MNNIHIVISFKLDLLFQAYRTSDINIETLEKEVMLLCYSANHVIWHRNIRNFICNALYTLQFTKTKTHMNTGIIYCQVVSLKILVLLANWSMRLLVFHNISSLSWRKMALHLDLGFIALSNIIYITDIANDLLGYILTQKYLNPQKKVLKYT